jgi:putative ABC transport system permease protein
MVAIFVGALALAGLAHAIFTIARARRTDIAVLRALGLRPYQRVQVFAFVGLLLTAIGVLVGVPVGLAVHRWLWSTLAEHIGISTAWFHSWQTLTYVVLVALASGGALAALQALHAPGTVELRAE